MTASCFPFNHATRTLHGTKLPGVYGFTCRMVNRHVVVGHLHAICDDLKFVLQTVVSAQEIFLTEIAAPHTMSDMREELDHLEERIGALAQLTTNMREENHALRQELNDAVLEVRSLKSRLDAARQRIEALIEKLPVTE